MGKDTQLPKLPRAEKEGSLIQFTRSKGAGHGAATQTRRHRMSIDIGTTNGKHTGIGTPTKDTQQDKVKIDLYLNRNETTSYNETDVTKKKGTTAEVIQGKLAQ